MKQIHIFGIIIAVLIIGALLLKDNKKDSITPDDTNVTTPQDGGNSDVMTDGTNEPDSLENNLEDNNEETSMDNENNVNDDNINQDDSTGDEGEVKVVVPQPPTAETPKYSGAVIKTSLGDITVSFYGADSPMTVNNFTNLAEIGFYDGILFHRVIPNFMIQTGDPLSKNPEKALHGTGGPGYKFADEFNDKPLVLGSLAMANSGPNTNGSQFFIVSVPATPWLDGKHTNFGQVTDGLDVVKAIEGVERDGRDNPIEPVKIITVELVK